MKKISLIIAFLFGIAISATAQTEIRIKTSAVCGMCKKKLESEIAYLKGVKFAKLNIDDKMLTVNYNEKKVSPEKIKIAISKLGYRADDVLADSAAFSKLPDCCRNPDSHHHE